MITVVIIAKNEENNIIDCLESLKGCGEIIVIDDNSTDRTAEISVKSGARVISHPLNGDFAAQRNFGLKEAKNEWVLFIDADERVSPELAEEIQEVIKTGKENGYFLKRKDKFLGKWLKYGETGDIKLLRLGRKEKGEWERKVHEVWNVETHCNVSLQSPLFHYPHPSIKGFLKDLNNYSTVNAAVFYRQGKRVGIFHIIAYPLGKFLLNYFLKKGFLDGTQGFIMATMMSFHTFLTRVKIWQLQHDNN